MDTYTSLLAYVDDSYIESTIVIKVLSNFSVDRTIVECGIEDLDRDTVNVIVNTSGKSKTIV